MHGVGRSPATMGRVLDREPTPCEDFGTRHTQCRTIIPTALPMTVSPWHTNRAGVANANKCLVIKGVCFAAGASRHWIPAPRLRGGWLCAGMPEGGGSGSCWLRPGNFLDECMQNA